MPQNYKNQPSINRFNFARWYQDKNLFQNAEFAIGSGNNFTNWSKIIPTHENILPRSQEFDLWTKDNCTVTSNGNRSPVTGALLADKVTVSNVTTPQIYWSITSSIGQVYTFSIWIRAINDTQAVIELFNTGVGLATFVSANIMSGPGSITSTNSATITGLSTSRWTRVSLTCISVGTTLVASFKPQGAVISIGDEYWISDAQLQKSNLATANIITSGTAITGVDDGEILPAVRSNILRNNTNYNSGGWGGSSAFTFTPNQSGAYGTNTAQKIQCHTAVDFTISQSNTLSTKSKYCYSFAIKKGNIATRLNSIIIYNNTKGYGMFDGWINLDTKVLTTNQNQFNASFNKIEINSEWTLIYVAFENGFSAGDTLQMYTCWGGGVPTLGDFVYIDSPQLEFGDYPSAAITTNNSTVTVTDGINATRAVRLNSGYSSGLAINQASVLDAAGNYKLTFWAKKASALDSQIKVLSETSTFDTISITTTYYKKYEAILPALTPDNQVSLYNNIGNSSVVIDNARLELVQEGVSIGTPNPYYLDPGRLSFPILTATDNFQFYLNADTPITGYTKSDLIPILCNENGIREYAWSTSVLNEISVGAGVHYYSNSIPLSVLSALSEGLYYFAIYNNATGNILWTTNYFYLYKSGYEDFSSAVKFRNYKNIFKVQYETLTDFYQQFRIMLVEKEVNYGGEKNQYREISTGAYRTTQVYDERVVRAETYYFDREMHEAMDNMTRHDTITINSKSYIAKGNYEPNLDQTSKISKGEIELIDQEFSQINS